jgi:hypothetical protein
MLGYLYLLAFLSAPCLVLSLLNLVFVTIFASLPYTCLKSIILMLDYLCLLV